mmetsp:Transcript_15401/g.33381  ORF Transcript_15401/g.33381 Transcript_15401/m.33381 type:complete len:281 (-) Transcript_15401:550-1392(-)
MAPRLLYTNSWLGCQPGAALACSFSTLARYLPCCSATCARAGSGLSGLAHTSPRAYTSGTTPMESRLGVSLSSARMLTFCAPVRSPSPRTWPVVSCFGGASTRMNLSTARRPTAVLVNGSESVKGVGPTPVDQMQRPYGMTVPSVRVISLSFICLTMPLRSCTPRRISLRAAYSRRLASKLPSTSFASISVTLMDLARSGYRFLRSWLMKSVSSPATSTPVGPPPTMTMCSRRWYSSVCRPGMPDFAMFSISLLWMASACFTSRRKWACSRTPGMLNVLP